MKTTVVLGAMDSEVALLVSQLEQQRVETHSGVECHCGFVNGNPVVVVRCGIGKVNAARATQLAVDCFDPYLIINSGIAGGLASDLSIGDVIVGVKLVEHDFDLSPIGYVRGCMAYDSDPKTPTYYTAQDAFVSNMLVAAQNVAKGRKVRPGTVASGDVFVADAGLKRQLSEDFKADVAEMEGAAIAHVADACGVPFLVLRVVSDLANGEAPSSFEQFEKETADLSANIILEFCGKGK